MIVAALKIICHVFLQEKQQPHTIVREPLENTNSLPLTAVCELSSGNPRFFHNLAPAHQAGLAADPTTERKETMTSVHTEQL